MTYPVGMFIRAEEEENIVKIGFFFTEILAAGGRRPLYTLFIDKKKDCFIGYDYRLKSWTNKMLDKIEYPNGVKKHHAWCDLKSLEIIRKTVEETVRKMKYMIVFGNLKSRCGEEQEYKKIGRLRGNGTR